jgi:hypothetical protein
MKKNVFIVLLGLLFAVSCLVYVPYSGEEAPPPGEYPVEPVPAPTPMPALSMDVSYFYDSLSPYGMWVYHPTYRYVWVPYNMSLGWRPYTHGQWLWTDYGWTWYSSFAWGWAPFHYGRWGWDMDFGWYWVPETVWGPGWVTWRYSDLYIGWAPLPPGVHFVQGVGIGRITVSIPYRYWVFVSGPYFLNPSLQLYAFPYERNMTIINYTVHQTNIYVRNNRVVNEGIGYDRVRGITKTNITKHTLKDVQKAEQGRISQDALEIYRPQIKDNQAAKPKTIVQREEVKQRISQGRIQRDVREEAAPGRERSLKEAQEKEIKMLEESQQTEIKQLERKKEEVKRTARSEAEKAKVEAEYREKALQLKKSHEQEKTEIKQRHEKEVSVKKKTEPEKKEAEKKETTKKIKKKKK